MLYEMFQNDRAGSIELKKSFEFLEHDHYTKGPIKFRFRSYSTGTFINAQISWSEKVEPFFQSDSINKYLGGVERNYPFLEPVCRGFIEDTLRQIYELKLIPEGDYDLAGHQIRLIARQGELVQPTPEGFHQDGFDFLAISCIDKYNIEGGTTKLRDIITRSEIYSSPQQPHTTLVLNDRMLEHYVSPITPVLNDDAYRDVVIITLLKRQASRTESVTLV